MGTTWSAPVDGTKLVIHMDLPEGVEHRVDLAWDKHWYSDSIVDKLVTMKLVMDPTRTVPSNIPIMDHAEAYRKLDGGIRFVMEMNHFTSWNEMSKKTIYGDVIYGIFECYDPWNQRDPQIIFRFADPEHVLPPILPYPIISFIFENGTCVYDRHASLKRTLLVVLYRCKVKLPKEINMEILTMMIGPNIHVREMTKISV
jgi:hypothetical protein